MRAGGKETEIKLAIGNAAAVRRCLRRQGFRLIGRRSFEQNILFDSAGRVLRRRHCMLRLRSVNGCHWLTFKGPSERSLRYKVRQEYEIELTNAEAAGAILVRLGFAPVFRYEKFRTVYAGRGRWQSGEVMLDETPIGKFIELEGPPAWIRRVARALGVGPEQFITQTYAALYFDWCRRHRRPPTHMVFPVRRRGLGLTKEKRNRI